MNRLVAFLLTFLMVSSTITPAVLAGEGNKNRLERDISEYQEDLLDLNEKIAKVYQEINEGKKGKETYPHAIKAAKETAEMIGKTNELATLMSESGFETGTTNLSSQLEDIAIYGFSSEVKDSLVQLGYSSEDIEALETKTTEYNAYFYRISTDGFNSEEIQGMKDAGYTDSGIENLENSITLRYSSDMNAAEQLNASKSELYQLQTTLSILSLKLLMDSSKEKGKISKKQKEHLYKLEKKLLDDIDKGKWNHIKDDGKELYKYSEMLIKKSNNASEFSVDYFIGLQMHLAAVTALEGDEAFALNVIDTYKLALEDLASKRAVEKEETGTGKGKVKASIFNPLADSIEFGAYKILSVIGSLVPKFSIPSVVALPGIVGQVDELDETNNVVETTITVYWDAEEFSELGPVLILGPVFAGSGGLGAVLTGIEIGTVGWAVIIVGIGLVAYVVINEASNPIIEKYKKEIDNGDGTITVIEKNVKLNGDVVFYIWIRDKVTGRTLLFKQIAYNSRGVLEHTDEKYRDPFYIGDIPNIDYFNDQDGWDVIYGPG